MRKLLIAVAAMGLFFASCTSGDQFKLNGKVEGQFEGKVYLSKVADNKLVKIDSTFLTEGGFEFIGSVDAPELYFIQLEGQRAAIKFFVENSDISIAADIEKLQEAVVTGSANNDVFVAYNDTQKVFQEKNETLYKDYQAAAKAGNQTAVDSIRNVAMKMEEEKTAITKEFVASNSNSVVAGYLAYRLISGMEIPEMEETYNALGENVKTSIYGAMIKEKIDVLKSVVVGQPAPDFTLNTPEGTPFSLSSLKGKVVVIDFWASWCGPCRRENPHMVEMYNEVHENGVEFLGVSLDRNKDKWLEAIDADGLIWSQVFDVEGKAANKYGVESIPFTIVLDKSGNIAAKRVFGAELKAEIEKLL